MKRFWTAVFLALIVMILMGCGGEHRTPTQVGGTPTQEIRTIVPETPMASNTATETRVVSTSTPFPYTDTPVPTATRQNTPTVAATIAPTEQPTQSPTLSASAQPEVSPTLTASIPPEASPTVVTSSGAPASPDDCIDKAGFFADVTVPDNTLFQKDTKFTKTWRFRNEGTCTWGDGYLLVFANGHIMSGPPSSPLPKAAPGEIIDVSVNLISPSEGGAYAGDWQFQNARGKRFGVNSHGEDMFWVIIKVDWGPGIGPTPTPPPVNCTYQRNLSYEAQLLQLINGARIDNGLPALVLQDQLGAAALGHSTDMACNNYFDHTGSDKSSHSSRLTAQGYSFSYESENIFAGGNAQDAFDWWMNSPVHRANILSKKVTQIGIGFAYFASSQYGGYYTLDFAKPQTK